MHAFARHKGGAGAIRNALRPHVALAIQNAIRLYHRPVVEVIDDIIRTKAAHIARIGHIDALSTHIDGERILGSWLAGTKINSNHSLNHSFVTGIPRWQA